MPDTKIELFYEEHYPGTLVELIEADSPSDLYRILTDKQTDAPVGVIIDVSHWQGEVDWAAAKASGVTHAFIKASDGPDWVDPQFARNWAEAKKHGIQRGSYHYFRNYSNATDQSITFLEALGDDYGELPPVLDIEDDKSPVNAQYIYDWLLIVENATGVKPAVYSAKWVWDQYMDGTEWASDYKLWVANYTSDETPLLPNDWSEWWLWQYTNEGDGKLYGAESVAIDLNRMA